MCPALSLPNSSTIISYHKRCFSQNTFNNICIIVMHTIASLKRSEEKVFQSHYRFLRRHSTKYWSLTPAPDTNWSTYCHLRGSSAELKGKKNLNNRTKYTLTYSSSYFGMQPSILHPQFSLDTIRIWFIFQEFKQNIKQVYDYLSY